jgi:hypothetical protein
MLWADAKLAGSSANNRIHFRVFRWSRRLILVFMGIGVVFRGGGKKGRIKKDEGRGEKEEGGSREES